VGRRALILGPRRDSFSACSCDRTSSASSPRILVTVTGAVVDSINTFESPNAVVPKSAAVKVQNGNPSLTVELISIPVVSIEH
jgi:alpha-L-arabinofuranosidase